MSFPEAADISKVMVCRLRSIALWKEYGGWSALRYQEWEPKADETQLKEWVESLWEGCKAWQVRTKKKQVADQNNSRNALYLTYWNHTILRILDEHNMDHGLAEADAGTWIQPVMHFLAREARVQPIRFWGALSATRPPRDFPGILVL